jgi:hypothetical protein
MQRSIQWERCVFKGESKIIVTESAPFGPKKESFLWIKQTLDPLTSYIIFENDLKQKKGSIFDPDLRAYSYLTKENYTWQQVIDTDLSREYLVIPVLSGSEDKVLARVMGYGFPENTICYIYNAKEV